MEAEAKGREEEGKRGEGRARRASSSISVSTGLFCAFLCVAVSSGLPVVRRGGVGLRKVRSWEQVLSEDLRWHSDLGYLSRVLGCS